MKLRMTIALMIGILAAFQVATKAAGGDYANTLSLRGAYEQNKNASDSYGEKTHFTLKYELAQEDWRYWTGLGYGGTWDTFDKDVIDVEFALGKTYSNINVGGGLVLFYIQQNSHFIVDYFLVGPEVTCRGNFPFGQSGFAGLVDVALYPALLYQRNDGQKEVTIVVNNSSSTRLKNYGSESGYAYGFKAEAAIKKDFSQFLVTAGVRYQFIEGPSLKDDGIYDGDQFFGPFFEAGWKF